MNDRYAAPVQENGYQYKAIIVSRVLTGKSVPGQTSYNSIYNGSYTPGPVNKITNMEYNSYSGKSSGGPNPDIYVLATKSDAQCYPEFVINLKRKM